MFDIAFTELLFVAVITLVVMGPERLPETVRNMTLWVGRARRGLTRARKELEGEVGVDEIRRQLHNEEIMQNLQKTQHQVETLITEAQTPIDDNKSR